MAFDKSHARFPVKNELIYLSHCGVSPLYSRAADVAVEWLRDQQYYGSTRFIPRYAEYLQQLKDVGGALLRTQADNLAVVKNTSEALSMVANGYPFEAGDEMITFEREYPADYYPWILQKTRGVQVKLLTNRPTHPGVDPALTGSWSMEELEELVTPRTRLVAVSHVQFTSGYAADLRRLGQFCHERGIDLVIDAAQSLGSMPVYPEDIHVAALASSGWKWLLGPFGIGVFYTSPAFREKLNLVLVGAHTMRQGNEFTNLAWDPQPSAKRYEYSTSPMPLVAALATCIGEIHAHYGPEAIFREIIRLQDIFLERLDNPDIIPLRFPEEHRSGILSLYHPQNEALAARLAAEGIVCTVRGGYLRVAPHFYNTEADMERLARALRG